MKITIISTNIKIFYTSQDKLASPYHDLAELMNLELIDLEFDVIAR